MLTALSCRTLAADDSFRASAATLVNRRACFEASAAAWTERAERLERLDRLRVSRAAGLVENVAG